MCNLEFSNYYLIFILIFKFETTRKFGILKLVFNIIDFILNFEIILNIFDLIFSYGIIIEYYILLLLIMIAKLLGN